MGKLTETMDSLFNSFVLTLLDTFWYYFFLSSRTFAPDVSIYSFDVTGTLNIEGTCLKTLLLIRLLLPFHIPTHFKSFSIFIQMVRFTVNYHHPCTSKHRDRLSQPIHGEP